MFNKLRRYKNGVTRDNQFNYHKRSCPMYSHNITVIKNTTGMKYSDCLIQYCPFCGERLKG